MSGGDGRGLQVWSRPGLLHPGRAHQRSRLAFQLIGHVYDAGARLMGVLPMLSRDVLRSGEEDKIHTVESVWLNALDERDLVADGLKLAERRFVVHQHEVGCAEDGVV